MCRRTSLCFLPHRRATGFFFFFFNDTATTEIYTLSLHDALPILVLAPGRRQCREPRYPGVSRTCRPRSEETRLNSSHVAISYAVFCLKKKKKKNYISIYKKKKKKTKKKQKKK